jgi:hypothetical protein
MLADAIMLLHLGIVVFNAAMLLLVPIGARRWQWVRYRPLRLVHLAMMLFIAVQALLGKHCPLTLVETALRDDAPARAFLMRLVETVLYWPLPLEFFAALYLACAVWTLALWVLVRPASPAPRTGGPAAYR